MYAEKVYEQIRSAVAGKCTVSAAVVPNDKSLFISAENIYDYAVQTIINAKRAGKGQLTFFSKLIEGEYIDYNRIILRNHRITVYADRESVISALEHAALITEEKVAGSVRSHVRLEVQGNILKISATSGTGSSYDEVAIGHEGDDLVIAFNNRYLIDSLRACQSDRVKLSMSSPLSSINIEPNDENTTDEDLFMLLPVRMKD